MVNGEIIAGAYDGEPTEIRRGGNMILSYSGSAKINLTSFFKAGEGTEEEDEAHKAAGVPQYKQKLRNTKIEACKLFYGKYYRIYQDFLKFSRFL